jgi:hypothetical protein
MSDFAPGDRVTPIRLQNPQLHSFRLGGIYLVEDVVKNPFFDQVGLVIAGHPSPHMMRAWGTENWRKVRPASESFTRQMRALRPIKTRVEA